jgi:hypothetical protein
MCCQLAPGTLIYDWKPSVGEAKVVCYGVVRED